MNTPIHHTFAPHADGVFRRRAFSLFLRPWTWKRGAAGNALTQELRRRYGKEPALFSTGREALAAYLQACTLPPGSDVIVQGYTCVVVPNAITAAGHNAVFADINADTLNLTADSVRAALTPNTKAVICQHTFGIPAPVRELRALCDEKHLLLIEDCAHVLPDAKGPKEMTITADAVIVSFGRDKAVSGVTGGALLARDAAIASTAQQYAKADLSLVAIKRLLAYPLLYGFARTLPQSIRRLVLGAYKLLHQLPPILSVTEKRGQQNEIIHRLPNACATLALASLTHLEAINDHRRALTTLYLEEGKARGWPLMTALRPDLPLQKFPLFTPGAERIRQKLQAADIHLHDGWTGCVICPANTEPDATNYCDGMNPSAEMAGQQILSLPTHPTMTGEQAKKLIETLDPLLP